MSLFCVELFLIRLKSNLPGVEVAGVAVFPKSEGAAVVAAAAGVVVVDAVVVVDPPNEKLLPEVLFDPNENPPEISNHFN